MPKDSRFVLASRERVRNIDKIKHVDWNLCYLCQQKDTDDVKSPLEFEATPQGRGRKYSAKDEFKKNSSQ